MADPTGAASPPVEGSLLDAPSRSAPAPGSWRNAAAARLIAALALATATAALYARTCTFDFITYDDTLYVTENVIVQQGLTWPNGLWALTTHSVSNWQPLTWLSHMLDVELWGLDPGPPHLVNAALHVANGLLVLCMLALGTGRFWLSLIAAALFALHPLRVESVAWVAERKDVLCTFFSLLAIIAYLAWARRPTLGLYVAVVAALLLALMAKPMAVTVPCLLLLLDYWPLNRLRRRGNESRDPPADGARLSRLILEKLPLAAMAVSVEVLTMIGQAGVGAVKNDQYPLGIRLGNALVSYARYIGKSIWPRDMILFYPHPGQWPATYVLFSGLALALVTLTVVILLRRLPFLAVGWFWFVGTLVPVIGIVQVGRQAMADRYTYFPAIGLAMAFVWCGWALIQRQKCLRAPGAVLALGAVVALSLLTARQLDYWAGGTLGVFEHALRVDERNAVAHHALGYVRFRQGQHRAALQHLYRARQIDPGPADLHFLLGHVLREEGRIAEAIASFEAAAQRRPTAWNIWLELGDTQKEAGAMEAAEKSLRRALELNPGSVQAREKLRAISSL